MEFVTYEIAKKLKEKGYTQVKKNTLAMYDEDGYWYSLVATTNEEYRFEDFDEHDCVCPAISQVLKWLREEKKVHINVGVYPNGWNFFCCSCEKHDNGKFGDYNIYESLEMHNSYELAAIAGIEYVLNNLI